jgi:intracellular septation protein A
MKTALLQLGEDLLSALAFILVFQITGQLILATVIAILVALGQLAFSLVRKRKISSMQWMLLAVVIVLSMLTLITKDSRFVQLKPSIAHFAIAGVMLKRGWQQPYLPPLVTESLPERTLVAWGYAWAALMVLMGLANVVAANVLSVGAWGVFLIGLLVGKLVFFLIQYAWIRAAVRARLTAPSS